MAEEAPQLGLPGDFSGKRSPLSIRETIAIVCLGFSMVAAGSIAWERVSSRLDRVAELLLEMKTDSARRDAQVMSLDERLQRHQQSAGHPIAMEKHSVEDHRLDELERRMKELEHEALRAPAHR